MNTKRQLKLQACLDGELSSPDVRQVQSWLQQDPELQALSQELQETRSWLQQDETKIAVPLSREFYWSQIECRIQTTEAMAASPQGVTRLMNHWWWKWLAPAAAVGLLFVVLSPGRLSKHNHLALNGLEIDTNPEANVVAFQSDQDGVTVVWVDMQ